MAQVGDKVQMMYDFEGMTDNHELMLNEGDVIVITNPDVGEGWWEGQDASGTVGLFPSSYAELVSDGNGRFEGTHESYLQQQDPLNSASDQAYASDTAGQYGETDNGDDWETSWDSPNYAVQQPASPHAPADSAVVETADAPKNDSADLPKKGGKGMGRFGGINIFSSFSTSPAEAFVLGENKPVASGKPKIYLTVTEDGPMWDDSAQQHFTCTIANPQKASKFSGFKSYITYNITPSHTGVTVSRRYKHFDWLYEQLSRKFSVVIAIPPLPDKQLTGRYEDEFIEGRMSQLQGWIMRMSVHPVVSQSDVFQHFLTSKDSEKAWKDGKRKAESDPAVGGAFCTMIVPAEHSGVNLSTTEQTLQHHTQFTKLFDDALKQTISHGSDYVRKCQGPLMREYQKVGQCFGAVGNALKMDERQCASALTEAINHTARTYEEIGSLYHNQPKLDWNPLLEGLIEYKGFTSCCPNILGNNKSAFDKQREVVRLQSEGKHTGEDVEKVNVRVETLSLAVQAEMNHMQSYRVGDFATYMKNFVQEQVVFYQNIVSKLQETAAMYDSLP